MGWIITGASHGLGKHLMTAMAARGHTVVAMARNTAALAELAAACPPGRVLPHGVDLADRSTVVESITAAMARVDTLDGVINNAGFGLYKFFTEHSEQALLDVLQVNLGAVMQVCHAVVPTLIKQRSGHIINIGSDVGRRPLAKMAAYVAAKHGLAGFSHSLLRELKVHGVKVSLVNPGIIDTDFGGGTEGSRDAAWSLRPAQLAALIVTLIEQPGNLTIDELSVHALNQDEY
jgi:short-subunit dehydrogenase